MDDDKALVILARVADGPPAVPADVSQCEICEAPCWISKETGAVLMDKARETGYPVQVICVYCVMTATQGAEEVEVHLPEAIKAEFLRYMNRGLN